MLTGCCKSRPSYWLTPPRHRETDRIQELSAGWFVKYCSIIFRDHGATLRLGGGGTVSDSILRAHKTLFLSKLFIILKLMGGTCPPPPCSTVPDIVYGIVSVWK